MPKVISMNPKAAIFLLLIIPFFYTGCSKDERRIKIYSDKAEVAELVNLFNQSQSDYIAEFTYASSGNREEIDPGEQDIVIISGLHSSYYKEKLSDLNSLRKNSFVQNIYPELLKTGILDTTLKSIPLSLNLPLVISREAISNSKYLSWEEAGSYAAGFNTFNEDELTHTGFSPSWSESFVTSYFNNRINSFSSELKENDFKDLQLISQELVDWITETNQSQNMCLAFSKKYRYIPDYRLILNGRIALGVMTLEDYALLPDSITRELSVEFLKYENGVQNTELLSAGIPLLSENPEGALLFLKWLLEESTWEDYLTVVSRNRDETFGFLGGLSAAENLNSNLLVSYYPWMKNHIPRAGEFAPQPQIEAQWPLIWNKLLLPLVIESIRDPHFSKDISNEYRKWLLLNPDPWK